MKLSDLMPNIEPIVVELLHPETEEPIHNADGTPMSITMFSKNSTEYTKVHHKTLTKLDEDADRYDKSEAFVELLAKGVKEWNVGDEYTVETAIKLFSHMPWILPQISEAMAKEEDFT